MTERQSDRPTGPWQERVRFGPGGSFAYRPGELLVPAETADQAERNLRSRAEERGESDGFTREEGLIAESYVHFRGVAPGEDLRHLHEQGIHGQVNHVLFATSCGCPPHPADPAAKEFDADPFYANPFYAHGGFGCGCGCGCGRGPVANPFYAHPFYAHPFYAHASPSPFAEPSSQRSGRRASSALPASAPTPPTHPGVQGVRIAVLDTGWADAEYEPKGLQGIDVVYGGRDRPDEDGDGRLDPTAGHGTFIAGIIEQVTPGCHIEVVEVLSTYGEGEEAEIASVLDGLARRVDDERPDIVNLSFGGYSPLGMGALTKAINRLDQSGTVVVASAGNDATCYPLYPAALENVVAVGALDEDGEPAIYTNYGPWVDASAPGTNLVSLFFDGFNGPGWAENTEDPDDFQGWARWSGTSFATPVVAAVLAREVGAGKSPREAVATLIRDENLTRIPMLGTVIDPT
jgi:hypothetical protein